MVMNEATKGWVCWGKAGYNSHQYNLIVKHLGVQGNLRSENIQANALQKNLNTNDGLFHATHSPSVLSIQDKKGTIIWI